MENKFAFFFLVVGLLCGCLSSSSIADCDGLQNNVQNERYKALTNHQREELFAILKRDGFSGELGAAADLTLFGDIRAGNQNFSAYLYVWNFGNDRQAHRILVLNDKPQFLGMYSIDELPTGIKDSAIIFLGDEGAGNRIVLNEAGPPAKIFLDGETRELFK